MTVLCDITQPISWLDPFASLIEDLGQVKICLGHPSVPFVPCNGHFKNYSGGPSPPCD